jgi:predicted ATPase
MGKNNREKSIAVQNLIDEIEYLKGGIKQDLEPLYQQRNEISNKIFETKMQMISIFNRLKKPLDLFLDENADLINNYSISIRSGLVIDDSFQSDFFNYINRQKRNAFREEEYQLHKTIDKLNEIEAMTDYVKYPELIMNCMYEFSNDISSQLKDGKLMEFYNYLYGLKYITNTYELISDNKTLDKLSPGERGALLLIFYLLLDFRDNPLIIDQPEDNLDNQSVAKVLVPFIQVAKKRRQIILVTHNPNLAVVADSDQIIHAKIIKDNNQVVIEAGSIEDPTINACIVAILEGTMHSFRKRDGKYIE